MKIEFEEKKEKKLMYSDIKDTNGNYLLKSKVRPGTFEIFLINRQCESTRFLTTFRKAAMFGVKDYEDFDEHYEIIGLIKDFKITDIEME